MINILKKNKFYINKITKDLEKEDHEIEELDLDSLIRLNDESKNLDV